MKFSVLVPIYNVDIYLPHCIDSILQQGFQDFELILVVDGSPDTSLSICENYAKKDNRIVVINKENEGLVCARKSAAQAAKGDYIICVDGDDYIYENLLENLNEIINNSPGVDLVCYGYCTDEEGQISTPYLNGLNCGIYTNTNELLKIYLINKDLPYDNNGEILFSIWTKCIRNSLYKECQLKVPDAVQNGEDILCVAYILQMAKKTIICDIAGYYYRLNSRSMTHNRKKSDLQNLNIVKRELENIGCYSFDNIAHYYLHSIYILAKDMAKNSDSFQDFFNLINSFDYDDSYNKTKFYYRYSILSIVKYEVIINSNWLLFYILMKISRIINSITTKCCK